MVKTLEDGLAAARKYKESAKNANSTKGLAAPGVDDFTADIAKIVPDLKDLTREMIFTQVYSREELSMKFRAIVVLSSLITQGVEPEIAIHVHTGLNVGLTPNDITNLAVNLWVPKAGASLSIECALPYIGFPRVLNALKIMTQAFKERGYDLDTIGKIQADLNKTKPPKPASKPIMREYRDAIKASGGKQGMAMAGGAPNLAPVRKAAPYVREILEATSEMIYARPGFGKKERSLVIVSSLVTQGNKHELMFHTDTALNIGLTPQEVLAIGATLIGYVGFPKGLGALRNMAIAMERRGIDIGSIHPKEKL